MALAACASNQGDYPSLAIRDVERAQGQFEPIEVEPLAVPPIEVPGASEAGLAAHLASLVQSARNSHARFEQIAPATRDRVREGADAAIGSNSWGAAQIALADLESARSDSAVALADLDTLHIAATVSAEDRSAIDIARKEVLLLVEREDQTLALLRGMMQR